MKFNFFSVFFHKSQRGLNSLISTKDKIEEIRYQYNKNAERYIKSAEDMLTNAKELKAKFEELDVQTVANKRSYESLIEASKTDSAKLDEAKIKYITYKGMKTARDTIETAWKNTEQQCIKVRDTLKNIDTNKALIEAKLTALNVQIDTLKMCDCNVIGDFGVDCNEMIAEIERKSIRLSSVWNPSVKLQNSLVVLSRQQLSATPLSIPNSRMSLTNTSATTKFVSLG